MPDVDGPLQPPSEADFLLAKTVAEHRWFDRTVPSLDPEPALGNLHEELVEAANLYQSGELADERYAVVQSLMAVHQFLRSQGFSALTLAPCFRPIDALRDQYENRLDPMFSERKRGGRPGMSEAQANRFGILAALTNFWLELHSSGGDTEMQIAAAARRFKGRWFGQATKAQLKRARLIVSQEAGDHPAVTSAKRFQEFIEDVVGNFGREGAMRVLIRHLNDLPRSPALGNVPGNDDKPHA